MKAIHLHGHLGGRFGGPFSLDVRDPAEAVRALSSQLPGFREVLAEGDWQVVRGPLDAGEPLDEAGLALGLAEGGELHLLPAVAGAGGDSGLGKVIAGVALVAAAGAFIPATAAIAGVGVQSTVAGLGISMALGGVAQMLAPSPQVGDYGSRERPDQRPSFLFDGPVNTSTQGLPVPLVYGRVRAGSVVISAGMNAEEI
ncbi:hypothetical protein LG302_01050 [Halomonas organivorans]